MSDPVGKPAQLPLERREKEPLVRRVSDLVPGQTGVVTEDAIRIDRDWGVWVLKDASVRLVDQFDPPKRGEYMVQKLGEGVSLTIPHSTKKWPRTVHTHFAAAFPAFHVG